MKGGKVDTFGIVLLAAGEGKRLASVEAKPLAPLMGRKLIDFSLRPILGFLRERGGCPTVMLGHKRELVEEHLWSEYPSVRIAYQEEPRGTGDAVREYFQNCDDAKN